MRAKQQSLTAKQWGFFVCCVWRYDENLTFDKIPSFGPFSAYPYAISAWSDFEQPQAAHRVKRMNALNNPSSFAEKDKPY